MLFDTDILIWVQRGNKKAGELIETSPDRKISLYTYLELLQGTQSKRQHRVIKDFLYDFSFETLPLTPAIGHRAAVYLEEYALAHGLSAGDSLIAATAVENNLSLATSNQKHFKVIHDLKMHVFKP